MDFRAMGLGLMTAVIFAILMLSMTFTFYNEENLNVSLSTDPDTVKLSNLSARVNESMDSLEGLNVEIKNKTLDDVEMQETVDSATLLRIAWSAFKSIPSYVGLMISLTFMAFGIILPSEGVIIITYILGAIMFIIALMIANAIMGSRL